MSLKQILGPRKPKKRPYRRRDRNKTLTNINYTEDKNENENHSRTLSYKPLTPIAIETTFTSPLPSPSQSQYISPNITPSSNSITNHHKSMQSGNFLTFSEAAHNVNLSVSLPSSPIKYKHRSTESNKNLGFRHQMINKMQRFNSANNATDRDRNVNTKTTNRRNEKSENVRVMVRLRPYNKTEKKHKEGKFTHNIRVCCNNKKMKMFDKSARNHSFRFDHIFDGTCTQKDIFENIGKPICDDILQFKSTNGTIFCYGQSGSGKTYTMFGGNINSNSKRGGVHRRCTSERIGSTDIQIESMGIIGRSCCYIYDELQDMKESLYNVYTDFSYNLYLECIEIYNEKLKDLLNSKQSPVIREIAVGNRNKTGFITEIQNVTRKHVKSIKEMINILQISSLNRNISKTSLNETSSRSHMIIRLIINTLNADTNKQMESYINFVDLAGSENINKTKPHHHILHKATRKKQVKEAGNILKSLTALSQVIDALIKNKKHIPYKDSKLTRMLQNSLGGNCKTGLLICASPHMSNRYETIRSLKFGLRCQRIHNCIEIPQEDVIKKKNKETDGVKPVLTLNHSKSLTLTLNDTPTVSQTKADDGDLVNTDDTPKLELKENKSVVIKDDNEDKDVKYEKLMKQIEELNIENDLLRTKETLSHNVSTLNETISRIVIENALRKKGKKKKKKNKNVDVFPKVENELNVFENKLMQITIGINAKIAKIQDSVNKGLLFCDKSDDDDDDDDESEDEEDEDEEEDEEEQEEEQEKEEEVTVISDDVEDDAIKLNDKIYSERTVQHLKQKNEALMEEINRLKMEKEQDKKTKEYTDFHEGNDTYYICDDDQIYQNIPDDTPLKPNVSLLSLKAKKTLSEQLNILEKLRCMDKDNLHHLQSPINLQKYERSTISPRDSITLLTHLKSNRSSNSSYSGLTTKKTAQSIATNSTTFYDTPSPTSARSSLNSHSGVSTTIESIDEHLEKWNGSNNKHRISNIYNQQRRSSLNTAISIELSSTTIKDTDSIEITPSTLDLEQSVTYGDIPYVDDEDKQRLIDFQNDPILKEENEENEEEEMSDDDQFDSTDEDTYYDNSFGCNELMGNSQSDINRLYRTRTDSQIFRSEGMELTKKFKAKSVESPCLNNQRLSSSFAIHWINLKKKK